MFRFKVKAQGCSLSFIESEEKVSFGPSMTTLQAVLTFENGRSWVLPLPLLSALVEPADGEAQMFIDGLAARFAPPKPGSDMPDGFDVEQRDGGFSVRVKKPKP